ncbi:MAG: pyruvate, phosphate dikinase [Eubacteriales bacterium]|nr:pyruvate, phosphate dikinase [Eubacteriales bacterium]
MMAKKYVYLFKEGNAKMRNLLGGKGANLAEMTNLGLPVPQGFTVTTEACNKYYKDNETISDDIVKQIEVALVKTEKVTGKTFGSKENPLLVSVRSGARASMPGMMDTILNLGLNDEVVEGLATLTNNTRFAYDSYRRFITMFADVVMGVDRLKFEHAMDKIKEAKGYEKDTDLTADDLKKLVKDFKAIYKKELKHDFPQDPRTQLFEAVKAVFRSWNNPRAEVYRRMNDIPREWGTAVNVQSMVFGNMGETSGTGVAFTRNPATGEKALYGEYLMNAQGEDVVAGIRTPSPISHLKEQNIDLYNQFVAICNKLEKHYKDMQDMEFTIENGKLYMLQTRNGKRTAAAALQIAIDLVNEGMITKKEALLKIEPKSLDALLHPTFDAEALKKAKVVATGLAASPGAACGVIALSPDKAKELKKAGNKVVLVRSETSPEDIEGMAAALGVLTATGGMTSHAAVVARGMGTACVAGCKQLSVREDKKEISLAGQILKEGDYIAIDGSTGKIYAQEIKTCEAEITGNFATIMSWADELAKVKVRANADNERDAKRALSLGATGIGLCRTEHMFFEASRIKAVREMIIAQDSQAREKALNKILPMQKGDFVAMFKVMNGLPVTIRFLDPPLHEFLPHEAAEQKELAKELGKTYQEIKDIVDGLSEFNPMMGFRGCRLSIVMPEIAKMQTTAVIEAAIECVKKNKIDVHPEIMVPLVGDVKEFLYVKNIIKTTADELIAKAKIDLTYKIGTMIEIPRAAITSAEIAKEAQFFSFGTNDLTQMTFGFSRDDAGKFIGDYYDKRVLEYDPFVRIDEKGVGHLMQYTVKNARAVDKNFKIGICGEQGADPLSVEFAHKSGITYVSCSPFRVPIARLAAAQAAIRCGK